MISNTSRFGNFSGRPLLTVMALAFLAVLPAMAQSSWVIADFDGDHKPDLVTIDGVLHKTPGIRSGLMDDNLLALSSRLSGHRLRALDLDGDSDRDLVLKSESSVPLAVWINDGKGHFLPGSLEDFQLPTETENPQTLDATLFTSLEELSDEDSRGNASGAPTNFGPLPVRFRHPRMAELAARAAFRLNLRTRGPPSQSLPLTLALTIRR